MSYPGYLTPSTNLSADISLERSVGTFNFVVNDGGVAPGPVVPSELQSPANIIPNPTGGSATLSIVGDGASFATVFLGSNTQGSSSTINMKNGNFGASTIFMGDSANSPAIVVNDLNTNLEIIGSTAAAPVASFDPTLNAVQLGITPAAGVPPGSIVAQGVLEVQNAAATSFKVDPVANIVDVGDPLSAGAIYLNNTTTVTNSGSRPPAGGITLTQLTANSAQIAQQVVDTGTLQFGSSVGCPDILKLQDLGANTGQVVMTGNGGTGILFTPSINNAAATITTDRTAGNFGSLTIGSAIGVPVLQFSDSGAAFVGPVQTGLGTVLTIGGSINLGELKTINNYYNALGTAQPAIAYLGTGIIPGTNPPANGVGLYFVCIYAPSDAQAAQVSCVAYWNGSVWFGGATGNPAFRIQPSVDFTSLGLVNTSTTNMNGTWNSYVLNPFGPY